MTRSVIMAAFASQLLILFAQCHASASSVAAPRENQLPQAQSKVSPLTGSVWLRVHKSAFQFLGVLMR